MHAPESDEQLPWWSRDRNVAALLFAAAAALRFLHLAQIARHDPFFAIAGVDGAIYDAWAREILAGDWLGEGVLYLGPLYPLFMAAVYALFGESLPALKIAQVGLGAITCVLIWGVARHLFDRRVAALAGFIACFYKMHIFYGATVMIVNVQAPLVLGLAWSALRALRRPTFASWALCGLLLGLSALARQTTLLLAPILALWILYDRSGEPSLTKRFACGTLFGCVILALILPFTLKNYVAGDDVVLLNSTGGANFYMGNRVGADGTWQLPQIGAGMRVDNPRAMRDAFKAAAEKETGQSLKPSEISSYWLGRGLQEVRSDWPRWFKLEARKLGLFFNSYEVWNNRSVEVSNQFSWVLRAPLFSFGVVVPLGLFGFLLTARRWRELVPVYGMVFAYLASALLFFVLSRYRLPAILLFIPFAAFALFDLAERIRNKNIPGSLFAFLTVLVFAVFVHLPIDSGARMHMAYYNLGNKFRELERWDEAVKAYRASLEEFPLAISTHNNLALTLELAGRQEEAIAAWRTVGEMAIRGRDRVRMRRAARHLEDLTTETAPPEGHAVPNPDQTGTKSAK